MDEPQIDFQDFLKACPPQQSAEEISFQRAAHEAQRLIREGFTATIEPVAGFIDLMRYPAGTNIPQRYAVVARKTF